MIRWNDTSAAIYKHLSNTEKSNKMAVTWEPLVRLISKLEKAHTQVPSVDCDVIPNEEEEEL